MSSLNGRDDDLHHCDNSHRWLAPVGVNQDAWTKTVRAHVEQHRATMGGPPENTGPVCATPIRDRRAPAERQWRAARPETRAS